MKPDPDPALPARRSLSVLPLVAATYFMVAGGPYGLEELLAGAGYPRAALILLVTPVVWSLPTALLVGELSSALPDAGGYYAWVRRAMGPFWGFQEAWLSLAASVFDMAIYPTLFALYLGRLVPAVATGFASTAVSAAMIAACTAWNLRGARAVGTGSLAMTALVLGPFVLLTALGAARPGAPAAAEPAMSPGLLAGVLVAMWNYMGWDNASTLAAEVDRPQRSYPLAMLSTVGLVALSYLAPVLALWRAGVDPSRFSTGSWVDAGARLGGPWLGGAIVLGGCVSAFGMFNALVLSYSRLPVALADDGFLPAVVGRRSATSSAPVVSILLCGVAYTVCLGLGFERLVELDVMLYGLSLFLEFAALVLLRVREPGLPRPFRIPGGVPVLVLLALAPMALLAVAVVEGRKERMGSVSALWVGAIVIALGPAVYGLRWTGLRFRTTGKRRPSST